MTKVFICQTEVANMLTSLYVCVHISCLYECLHISWGSVTLILKVFQTQHLVCGGVAYKVNGKT